MKCPKCGYLGFEHVERCRNCGYDFSLTSTVTIPDIPIRHDTRTLNPLDDLSLIDAAAAPLTDARMADIGVDLERMFGETDAPVKPVPRTSATAPREDLTLFGPPILDDEPLITRASPPRPPLSVRRATPDVPRLRAEQPRTQSLDLGLELDSSAPTEPMKPASRVNPESWRPTYLEPSADASIGSRLIAVIIDMAILAAVDGVVIYFTMQICGITLDDLGILPKGPLLAFLFVQNGGYLVAFTAGGQTLGKMAAGIRVVTAGSESSLDLGRAFLRTLMWLALAVPAGLGFLTALFSSDHRGLHDRLAGTRVVR